MGKMIRVATLLVAVVISAPAHNSYTGGYSGAPGKSTCASSCHGGTGGTIQVSGFPASYIPGQTYPITIRHNGGNKFVNVNATTRLGTTTTVGGSFLAGSGSALYAGSDGGIYAPTHLVDSVVFQWRAPAAGSGLVTFYAAGFQGTSTGSGSGQSSKVSIAAVEVTTGVEQTLEQPREFALEHNYPNPFNPSTAISYSVAQTGWVSLKIFDMLGREVATLVNGVKSPGTYKLTWNASNVPSGVYFCTLNSGSLSATKKLILMR